MIPLGSELDRQGYEVDHERAEKRDGCIEMYEEVGRSFAHGGSQDLDDPK